MLNCPDDLASLKSRLLVFGTDFVEQNLKWEIGLANPVFFIGEKQGKAAQELKDTESQILRAEDEKNIADAAKSTAEKALRNFKRDRAKITASHLHLSGRKYEAPSLTKDYESWKDSEENPLSDEEFAAAEETCRLEEAMPRIAKNDFEVSRLAEAYRFIVEICGQSLTTVALAEVEKFPDMLMWLKQGHEFHVSHELKECLFCGNDLSAERKELLAGALDNKVDIFIEKLRRTEERLGRLSNELDQFKLAMPTPDRLVGELRTEFAAARTQLLEKIGEVQIHLETLNEILSQKLLKPATPADISAAASSDDLNNAITSLSDALALVKSFIDRHNEHVENFQRHKEQAESLIRRHFILECRSDYTNYASDLEKAGSDFGAATTKLAELTLVAEELRNQIREHGPAAETINQLIGSYLGHQELTIVPVDKGYELHRFGQPIEGVPSEGEKTAIAISYFLSSIEAEGRDLKNLIVVVDDPVSSLDTKALNYACTLVRRRLDGAQQVFILTHNLQCMNEFRKMWKSKAKPREGVDPTASFLFLDVSVPEGESRRSSRIVEMSKLLRDYDSEYHFLFSHVLDFVDSQNAYSEYGYMMPNVLRRVLDVFLAFKCPGSSGLVGQIEALYKDYPDLNKDRIAALERLSQVESHSDNLDDLLSFSSMTLEEARDAANALIEMMDHVDGRHLKRLKSLCK